MDTLEGPTPIVDCSWAVGSIVTIIMGSSLPSPKLTCTPPIFERAVASQGLHLSRNYRVGRPYEKHPIWDVFSSYRPHSRESLSIIFLLGIVLCKESWLNRQGMAFRCVLLKMVALGDPSDAMGMTKGLPVV